MASTFFYVEHNMLNVVTARLNEIPDANILAIQALIVEMSVARTSAYYDDVKQAKYMELRDSIRAIAALKTNSSTSRRRMSRMTQILGRCPSHTPTGVGFC